MTAAPHELIEALQSACRLLVAGHVTPDVDALGSMLALARLAPAGGAAIGLGEPVSNQKLRFLMDMAGNPAVADAGRIEAADVVAVVDTAGSKRVNLPGKWDAIASKPVAVIDHHVSNPAFGTVNWIVGDASSTCELIYRLAIQADWAIDPVTASLLYAGIYTDTGGFSLPNTTGAALEAAGELVRLGADVGTLGERICRSQERHEFELLRTVYANTGVAAGGSIAYSTISHQEMISAGASPEDIDDQVAVPRALAGVKLAMLFSEGDPGVIRINFRGDDGTPVLPLAQQLGGGGHTFSAGTRIRGAMAEVVARVVAEAERMVIGAGSA